MNNIKSFEEFVNEAKEFDSSVVAGFSDALVLYLDSVSPGTKTNIEKIVREYSRYQVNFTSNMAIISVNDGDPKYIKSIKKELGLK